MGPGRRGIRVPEQAGTRGVLNQFPGNMLKINSRPFLGLFVFWENYSRCTGHGYIYSYIVCTTYEHTRLAGNEPPFFWRRRRLLVNSRVQLYT